MNALKSFVVGPIETNCYLLYDEKTGDASVIDPGAGEDSILSFIRRKKLKIKNIILTHGHGDHIGAVMKIKQEAGGHVMINKEDAEFLSAPFRNLSSSFGAHITAPEPSRLLTEGDIVDIGSAAYTVVHTPGHTPGGICLVGEGRVFSGDTLFFEGIGRSDLSGGDGDLLIKMIREKLFTLPDETKVYPGHGPETSIGWEKEHNTFD